MLWNVKIVQKDVPSRICQLLVKSVCFETSRNKWWQYFPKGFSTLSHRLHVRLARDGTDWSKLCRTGSQFERIKSCFARERCNISPFPSLKKTWSDYSASDTSVLGTHQFSFLQVKIRDCFVTVFRKTFRSSRNQQRHEKQFCKEICMCVAWLMRLVS